MHDQHIWVRPHAVDRAETHRLEPAIPRHLLDGDFAVIVPAGARHNVSNIGSGPLKLYTLYGPPEHKDGVVQSTKAEAEARHHDEEWDGKTTE